MAILTYSGIGISAMAAAVPKTTFDNLTAGAPFTEDYVKEVVDKTGIRFRRIAGKSTCASDLCFAAAEKLLTDNGIDRQTIDVLLFVSQTPDYRMPATAILLQDRLGLGMQTLAFDINLGCSGFVYGLSLAYNYCLQPNVRRVLLLNGETRTKAYSAKDRATGLLFGDAGSATLIERLPEIGESFFSANSDGARGEHIIIPSGGYRNPSTVDSLKEREYEDGSIRTQEQAVMKGRGVFEFLLLEVPKDIKAVLEYSAKTVPEIDYFVFHQANRFMNEHLRKRMRIPTQKYPYSLDEFGNTSSVSIPLTLVTRIGTKLSVDPQSLFLCGFGVGLSWGSAYLPAQCIKISTLVELEDGTVI